MNWHLLSLYFVCTVHASCLACRHYGRDVRGILNRWNQLSVHKSCLEIWYENQTKGKHMWNICTCANRLWRSKQNFIRDRRKNCRWMEQNIREISMLKYCFQKNYVMLPNNFFAHLHCASSLISMDTKLTKTVFQDGFVQTEVNKQVNHWHNHQLMKQIF